MGGLKIVNIQQTIEVIRRTPGIETKMYTVIFEEGEAYISGLDIRSDSLLQSMARKLGKIVDIRPMKPEQKVSKYQITYKYYPNSRKHQMFLRRMTIKRSLPDKYKNMARLARRLTQKEFLEHIPGEFNQVAKESGYEDAIDFWRMCNYPDKPLRKQ